MRLECELTVERHGDTSKARSCKGFVTIGKGKLKSANGSNYQLQLSTSKERNQQPIELNGRVVNQLMGKFVSAGRLSILMRQPPINIYINKANPTSLERFVTKLQAVLTGKDIELDKITEVKGADFRAATRHLSIVRRDDYPANGFPITLEILRVNRIGLSRIDGRWFTLRLLRILDLSSNMIGRAVNKPLLANISKMTNLTELYLSDNQITELPDAVWNALPKSLITLNLSLNALTRFPDQILKLPNLRVLDLSHNQIQKIPETIFELCLSYFDMSHNQLTIIPFTLSRMRRKMTRLELAGNSFLREIPVDSLSRHEVVRLEDISAAAVANHGLPESVLPAHLRIVLPTMRAPCAQCLRWSAKEGMKILFRMIPARDMAMQVDGAGMVPAMARLCFNCHHVFSF